MEEDSTLQVSYQEEESISKFFRKVISLAFVPPRCLRLRWAGLKAGAQDDDRVVQFTETTWLNGHYHITEWSVYNEDEPQTNNHANGGITKSTAWQERVTQTYEIVELFKTEQTATEVSLLQLEAGGVVEPTRRVFRQKEKRLKTIQEKFSNNEYSLDEYISALSNWVGFRKL